MTNFLENSLSESISSWIIWIEKLDYFMTEFISLTMVAIEIEKDNVPVIVTTVATRKKTSFKNLNFIG